MYILSKKINDQWIKNILIMDIPINLFTLDLHEKKEIIYYRTNIY